MGWKCFTSAALMIYLSKFNLAHFLWHSPHAITTGIVLSPAAPNAVYVYMYYKDKRDLL